NRRSARNTRLPRLHRRCRLYLRRLWPLGPVRPASPIMSGNLSAMLLAEPHQRFWVQSIDPRFRLLATLGVALLVSTLTAPFALALALLAAAALTISAGVPLHAALRRLAVVEGFMLALLITMPFVMSGEPL